MISVLQTTEPQKYYHVTRTFELQTKTNGPWSRLKKVLVHGHLRWIVVCQLRGTCLQYLPHYVCPYPDVTIIKTVTDVLLGKVTQLYLMSPSLSEFCFFLFWSLGTTKSALSFFYLYNWQEICVGILANMACSHDVCVKMMRNKDLV